jgi:hypothetical protein
MPSSDLVHQAKQKTTITTENSKLLSIFDAE